MCSYHHHLCLLYGFVRGVSKKDHKAFSKTARIRESSLKALLFPEAIVHTKDQSQWTSHTFYLVTFFFLCKKSHGLGRKSHFNLRHIFQPWKNRSALRLYSNEISKGWLFSSTQWNSHAKHCDLSINTGNFTRKPQVSSIILHTGRVQEQRHSFVFDY